MFSFFKSKKPSPTQIPAEPIPGAGPPGGHHPPTGREDDFIFIERRGGPAQPADDSSASTTPGGGTPGGSAAGSGLYPTVPEPSTAGGDAVGNPVPVRQRSDEKVAGHALHGVPFRLSADIGQPTDMEITRIQANEILTYIGRVMYAPGYDFSLERSVLQD
uniref:UMA domain-containing protein n=1 Tax=Anopheles christyi TaxID=43041 RepID=A0A182KHG1_9DIPT